MSNNSVSSSRFRSIELQPRGSQAEPIAPTIQRRASQATPSGSLANLQSLGQRPRADSSALEASPSGAHREITSSVSPAASGIGPNNHDALLRAVEDLFRPHFESGFNDEVTQLIADRVQQLHAMGETAESIAAVFAKAHRMDAAASMASGFLGSIPFGAATVVESKVPQLTNYAKTPTEQAMAGGTLAHIFDAAGSELLRQSRENVTWLAPSTENAGADNATAPTEEGLAEHQRVAVVERMKERSAPSALQQHLEAAAAIQTFSARNIVRSIVTPAITATKGAAVAGQVDMWMSAVGSPLAGAASALIGNAIERKQHRVGPEYLLARSDWKQQYENLKKATWSGAAANGLGRLARIPIDVATNATTAAQSLLKPTKLATGAALTFGSGLSGAVQDAIAKQNPGHSPATTALATQVAGTVISGVVTFPAWTSAAVATDAIAKKVTAIAHSAGNVIQNGVANAASATLTGVGNVIDSTASRGAQVVGDMATTLRRRSPAAAGTSLSAAEDAV
ncbi:hypothetical protein G3O00_38220 [Burkholderia sp. Ac-20384]|uniref:hypothetical protein n=1 Tax=Burkholderia sp. Ac-20384 TaxID=2703902 RepID=UPI00197DFEEA|nr:hypothetical protein [Burkholderia sp. Ac-20384]MBN3829398.1 hypothetical protein [Burkholderia sp. Ac-20384]